MYWIVGPDSYETGKPPKATRLSVYWNPENLEKCALNLARSATALWLVLSRHAQISTRINIKEPPWPEGIAVLQEVLRWCQQVVPATQDILKDSGTGL